MSEEERANPLAGTPQAKNTSTRVIEDYFVNLAALMATPNLQLKPTLLYNADETGFAKVHKLI